MISLQPVTLDVDTGDQEARLVFRKGRLVAIVAQLGDIHEDAKGRWYLEMVFGDVPTPHPDTFDSLLDLERWLSPASIH